MVENEIQLRDYQQECVDLINQAEGGAHLIVVATGLGKTVIFSHIKRRGRMLVLSHRDELVHQPEKYFDCSFGVEKAKEISHGEDVVSASVQSLIRRLDKFKPDDFDIIVTDEAHHAVADSYRKIYDYFSPRLHLGFTATPNRADEVRLGEIYSDVLFERDLKWGIRNNYLTNIRCLQVNIGYDISHVKQRDDDFKQDELAIAVDQPLHNEAIAAAYKEYAVGQTLIFTTSVEQAYHVAELIEGAVVVEAETRNRSEIIEKFTRREIPCLVNCMVFTEGTDIPLIETVMIARPTRNASLYAQMVGRGLRKYEGKKELLLIDCVGVSGNLKLCTAPILFGLTDIDEEEAINGELLTDIEDNVQKKAQQMLIRTDWRLNAKRIDLFENDNGYDTHDVNYTILPNGDMICSTGSHTFKALAPDLVGNSRGIVIENSSKHVLVTIPQMPMQDILDFIYHFLLRNFADSDRLWNSKLVANWGQQPASDKQVSYITNLIRDRKKRREEVPALTVADLQSLNKYEASVLITQLTN